jgi:hypothetical protein
LVLLKRTSLRRFGLVAAFGLLGVAGVACTASIESDGLAPGDQLPTSSATPPRDPQGQLDAARPPEPNAGEATDAGVDSTVENSPATFEPHCGLPPYQAVRLGARDVMAPKADLAGVQVTLKHCPGQTFPVSGDGQILWVSAGAETWIRFDAPGFIPWVEGELRIPDAFPAPYIDATMMPRGVADIVMPVWKPDAPTIYVEVRTGRSSADEACRSPAGVALTVKDYPSAVVLYRNKGASADYGDGPGTSAEGVAVITGLPVGLASVELAASKPGCLYLPAFGDANSPELLPIVRAPLFTGAITHQVINPAR